MRVVILGGGSGGTTVATELRKLDKNVKITIIEESSHRLYSPCALPYLISGEIENFDNIFLVDENFYESNNINIMFNTKVTGIDKKSRKVFFTKQGKQDSIIYDKLVIALGNKKIIPKIKGIENITYYTFTNINDAEKLKKAISSATKAVIIGAGFIGIELAVALAKKDIKVTILEKEHTILSSMFDEIMSKKIDEYLVEKKIKIFKGVNIKEVKARKVCFESETDFDIIVLCCGVVPNIDIAKMAGLKVDKGIIVDTFLQTSDKNIFACGDCAQVKDFVTGAESCAMLGSVAVRQAKVIAKNLIGKKEKFEGVLRNSVSKIGDLIVGSVGITEQNASLKGIKCYSGVYSGYTKCNYFPTKKNISLKIVVDNYGKIIGAQIIGMEDVAGRLDLLSFAIQKGAKIEDIASMESCYNPAVAPIFEPVVLAAENCIKKMKYAKD